MQDISSERRRENDFERKGGQMLTLNSPGLRARV